MLIGTLSNVKDGGVTGIAVYNNKGGYVAKYDIPTTKIGDAQGDGYGYDIAVNPSKNVMLTLSFTGRDNYMRDIGSLIKDEAAMKLDGFGQDVSVEADAAGRPTRAINHMLKLFLIDADGIVREIYSLAFLHPEVMLNDIQTLLMKSQRGTRN